MNSATEIKLNFSCWTPLITAQSTALVNFKMILYSVQIKPVFFFKICVLIILKLIEKDKWNNVG